MTAPQIGNYGVAPGMPNRRSPRVAGFIMREASPLASNYRADGTLRDYLTRHGIVAIADIDTRALTRVLRSAGVMRGVIATGQVDPAELVEKARAIPKMEGADLVKDVTCEAPFWWRDSAPQAGDQDHREFGLAPGRQPSRRLKVAAYDFGIKYNILRRLDVYGCDVHVFPASAPAADLLAIEPDGIFLSNGPGDPAALPYAVDNVRRTHGRGGPDVRHLPRASDPRTRGRRTDLQAEVRTSRRQSSGQGARSRERSRSRRRTTDSRSTLIRCLPTRPSRI